MNKDVYLVVEGRTEQLFIGQVLAPYLAPIGLFLHPTQLPKSGTPGGDVRFSRASVCVCNFLKQRKDTLVSTFFDYYGLRDWPQLDEVHSLCSPEPKTIADTLNEAAIHAVGQMLPDIPVRQRFIPFLAVHEFESLLFSDPVALSEGANVPIGLIHEALAECGTPEGINNNPETAPSKRLERWTQRTYGKTTTGIAIAERIGIEAMRNACPNFDAWLKRLIDGER